MLRADPVILVSLDLLRMIHRHTTELHPDITCHGIRYCDIDQPGPGGIMKIDAAGGRLVYVIGELWQDDAGGWSPGVHVARWPD